MGWNLQGFYGLNWQTQKGTQLFDGEESSTRRALCRGLN